MTHKFFYTVTPSVTALALSIASVGAVGAPTETSINVSTNISMVGSEAEAAEQRTEVLTLTEAEALDFAQKISRAGSVFKSTILKAGKFKITVDDGTLQTDYGFTDAQIALLHEFAEKTAPAIRITNRDLTSTDTRARLFHISNYDLVTGAFTFLAAAAEAGPGALAAAWPLFTSLAGPVGVAVGVATSVLGTGFFYDMASKILVAYRSGKGVTFYSQWGFPPIKAVIEGK